jgi:hypothetical protein
MASQANRVNDGLDVVHVIRMGGDMAPYHCLKDRKNFHHRGAEARRSKHGWAHLNPVIY